MDKIFHINLENDRSDFKYVHLKIKPIKEGETLIQIIDISDKMLYNEAKAEHDYLALINATVSHELRNPLSSLINQKDYILDLLDQLENAIPKKQEAILRKISKKIRGCTNKIVSASKFIDFFVHDMLDYSLINKDATNFTKTINSFDIRGAIREITEILEDKIDMKEIKVTQIFKGFESGYKICTDCKRQQQIFLNILSNAVKFTNRGGKITIVVEL